MPQFDILGKMGQWDWQDHSADPGNMIANSVRPYVPPEQQELMMHGTWTLPPYPQDVNVTQNMINALMGPR